jgi:hypothetical protein
MTYIYSTLSTNQLYTKYATTAGNDMPRVERTVLVKGGANVADKNFITPRGVVTEVTDEELTFLKDNKLFNTHLENGYVSIEERQVNVDKVVDNMKPADESAPLTPESYEVEGKASPVTNSKRKK